MKRDSLFRNEAVAGSRVQWLGEIVMFRPLTISFLTTIAALLAALVVALFCLGSYTKRSSVSGQLMLDLGVVKVASPQAGIVVQKSVREGQPVRQGDLLYIVSSERPTTSRSDIQEAISGRVARRQQSLRDELIHTSRVQKDEEIALHRRLDGRIN